MVMSESHAKDPIMTFSYSSLSRMAGSGGLPKAVVGTPAGLLGTNLSESTEEAALGAVLFFISFCPFITC